MLCDGNTQVFEQDLDESVLCALGCVHLSQWTHSSVLSIRQTSLCYNAAVTYCVESDFSSRLTGQALTENSTLKHYSVQLEVMELQLLSG